MFSQPSQKPALRPACPKPRGPLFPCRLDGLLGECVGQVPAPSLVTSDTDVTVCWGRREVTSRGQTGSPPCPGREEWPGSSPSTPSLRNRESRGTTSSQLHPSWAYRPRHGLRDGCQPHGSAEPRSLVLGGSWPWAAGQLSFWILWPTKQRLGETGNEMKASDQGLPELCLPAGRRGSGQS